VIRCGSSGGWVVALAAALALAGCKPRGVRSPEKLRDVHLAALASDDPQQAYALLAPEVRASVPYAEFAERWEANVVEREATAAEAEALDPAARSAVLEGTTVHHGGHVLRWTRIGHGYVVLDGLPGVAQTQTPAQTVRALIEAVRTTDFSRVRRLLGDELAASIAEDWQARTDALEAALERPGSIELSADLLRAELRYEPNRVLTMEQTPSGWRISSLE
jgi:hypothetical protein